MRFHVGMTFRPKQIITFLGIVGAAIAGLVAGVLFLSNVLSFLFTVIGSYDYTLPIADWAWIASAAFLLLITWGIIIIIRSVISRNG